MSQIFKAERDTIAGLGLLTSTYIHFDPELESGTSVSHAYGFNVHCLVVDNADGEVLALERNRIHADGNPLQHAEQIGVRAALARLHQKRPRPDGLAVDKYYKSELFMGPGAAESDFLDRGCTLYNTFDPCGMCAVTLLVCYMKRIAYLFDDDKFAAVYKEMAKYFKGRESVKEPLALVDEGDESPLRKGARLINRMRAKVKQLEHDGLQLVTTLDRCRDELGEAAGLLCDTTVDHLTTVGNDRTRNARSLRDIKRHCNIT